MYLQPKTARVFQLLYMPSDLQTTIMSDKKSMKGLVGGL